MGVVSKSPQYRAFPRHSKGQPSSAELASHFDQWVRHFSPAWTPEQGNFDCYTPWNFETRYLSCGMPGAPDPMTDQHGNLRNRSRGNVMDSRQPPDESIALKMLNTFAEHGVVGVTDLFDVDRGWTGFAFFFRVLFCSPTAAASCGDPRSC